MGRWRWGRGRFACERVNERERLNEFIRRATGEEEAERDYMPNAARFWENKLSRASTPNPPRPDFSSLKPIGLFLHMISLSIFLPSSLPIVRDVGLREKERDRPTARDSLRERITGEKKPKEKLIDASGGRRRERKKEKSQGEWNIEYSFFFPLLCNPFSRLLARVYWFSEIPRETDEWSARSASAEETEARGESEREETARTTHSRLRASE